MSILVDTNILVYAVHAEAPQHEAAREFLERQRAEGGYCITWSILYEWLRVVTHPRVFPKPLAPGVAQEFAFNLAAEPGVDILVHTANHARFLQRVFDDAPPIRGNLVHDGHIAATMLEHGISTIATADHHFRLFSFLTVLDPTRGSPTGAAGDDA